MKKLLLTGALMAISLASKAQNCRSVTDKKDSFTGKTVSHAHSTVGVFFNKWVIDLEQAEGKTTLKWGVAVPGEANVIISEGSLVLFKLQDGTLLKLFTSERGMPVTQISGGNIFTQYFLKFNLTKEELTHLSKSLIEDMKVDVPEIVVKNPKIKSKDMLKIMDACACLLTTAN